MSTLCGLLTWGPFYPGIKASVTTSWAGIALNAAAAKMASQFSVAKAGTINKAYIFVSSVTGSPPDYVATIVTVSQGPTTTPYGGSAAQTFTPVLGWNEITFATPATAVRGDLIALAITTGGTAPDASNYITVSYGSCSAFPVLGTPSGYKYSVTSYYKQSEYSAFVAGLRYSDGSPVAPLSTVTGDAEVESDTTPDEVGAKFSVPFACKLAGFRVLIYYDHPTLTSCKVTLYDASDNILAERTYTEDGNPLGSRQYIQYWLDAPISLAANTSYRLTITATRTDYGFYPQEFVPLSATYDLPAVAEYSRWQRTERTDGGAWTDTAGRLPLFTLWLSEVTLETSVDPVPATIETGCPGDNITITGSYFGSTEGSVDFGGLAASIVSWAADTVVVTIPAGATDCTVTVTKADAKTGTIAFTLGDCGGGGSGQTIAEIPIHTGIPIGAAANLGVGPVR